MARVGGGNDAAIGAQGHAANVGMMPDHIVHWAGMILEGDVSGAPARMHLSLSLLALASLAALGVSLSLRGMGGDDPLGRRFRFALCIAGTIFAARVCVDLGGGGVFSTILRLAAALVPLAVVLVTEGLLRRHAPFVVKQVTLWGTGAGIAVAFWPSGAGVDVEDILLLVWQITGFVMAGVMILRRDRASLSAGENAMIFHLSWSLVCLMGVALFDFLTPLWQGQVRLAVLGVLVLCLIAVDATRGARAMWGEAIGAVGIAFITILALPEFQVGQAIVVLSAMLVAVIWTRVLGQRRNGGGQVSMNMAQQALGDDAVWDTVYHHPLLAESVHLAPADLSDSDTALLHDLAEKVPLVWRDHPALSVREREEVAHLCHLTGATHLIALGRTPLHWRALSLPALATDAAALGELSLLARLAQKTAGHKTDRVKADDHKADAMKTDTPKTDGPIAQGNRHADA